MNKIFKVIWNTATQSWVAVSELSKVKSVTASSTDKRKKLTNTVCIGMLGGGVLLTGNAMAATFTGNSITALRNELNSVLAQYCVTTVAIAATHPTNQGLTITTDTTILGMGATAYTNTSEASRGSTTAIGANANAAGHSDVAIGSGAKTYYHAENGWSAVAIGNRSSSTHRGTVAIGENANSSNQASMAIGVNTVSSGIFSTAIASCSTATGTGAVAIGALSNASGFYSTAIGVSASSTGVNSFAAGGNAKALAGNTLALGASANAVNAETIAIGASSLANATNALAVGYNTKVNQTNSVALGNNIHTTTENAVVLGTSSTDRAYTTVKTAQAARTGTYGTFEGTATGVVSVGTSGAERQIINVAPGEISAASTDAINGSQLFHAINAATTEVKAGNHTNISSTTGADGHLIYTVNANHTVVDFGESTTSATGTRIANQPFTISNSTSADGTVTQTLRIVTTPLEVKDGVVQKYTNASSNRLVNASSVADAINQSGWFVNTGVTGSGEHNSSNQRTIVSPGNDVTFLAGNNLIVDQDANRNITYSVNPNLTEISSISMAEGNTGIDMNNGNINNLANATTGDQAVNLSQLNASKANVVAGTNVQVSSTSDENGTTYTVNAYNTTASGSELVSVVAGELDPTTNTTNYAIDLSDKAKAQLAKEESVEAGSDAVSVKLDGTNETGGNKYVVDLSDETKTQLAKEESVSQGNNVIVTANGTNDTGGTDYKVELSNNLDLTEQGSLTIGGVNIAGDKVDVGSNTITNVANGTNATDAVNLSQLNASKANVVAGTNVQVSSSSDENGTTYTVNAYNTTASGSDAVTVEGEFDATTNTTNYAIDLSQAIKDQIAKEESVEAGSDAVSVKLDGTNDTGGNNYVVDLSDETKAQLAKEESVSQGNNVIVTANGTNDTGGTDYLVSLSNDLDLTDKGSLTIGDVNIAGDKVDVGGNTITNVADGTNATDAVNLSQLNASKANVVAGTNVQVSSTSDENGTTYTVNAYNTTASGSELVSVVAGELDPTTNTTNYAIDLSDKAKAQLAKEESVEAGSDAVSVKLDGTNETGGNKYVVDLSDETKTQLAKEESVSQGNNVIVTANGTNDTGGTDYLVSLSNDLDLTDKGSLTIGDVNIAGDKVDVGGNTITNVANGTNATDAVNLSQLNASKANVVAGTNVQVSSTSDENGTTYTVNAYNTTASGSELVSVVAGDLDPTTNTTNYAIDLSDKAKAQLAKEESVEAGSDAVSVKLDGTNDTGGNKYVVDLSQATKDQIAKEESVSQGNNVIVTTNGTNDTGGTDYKVELSNNLDLTEQGSLTIGDVNIAGDKVDVGGNTITNVANGTNATDAVNLSQLNASKANVVAGTNVQVSSTSDENGTTYTVNAYNTTASGSELVSVVAGDLDPTTNTTNYAIDLSDKAKAQLAKEESVEAGSDAVSVKLDGTNETGGNKYVVDLSQATKDQIAKEESVSQGNNVIVTANGTNDTGGTDYLVSLSNDLDLTDKGSLTIGNVSIAGDKVDVGGNTITNVANGTNATDAVNLSQLNASKANVVAGTNVQVSSTSDENGTTYTVNAYNTTASGSELVSVVAGDLDPTTNTTNYAIDLSDKAKAQLAKEESVEAGSDAVSVKLDGTNETGGNKYVVDLSDETKTQLAKEESVSQGSNVIVTANGTNDTGGTDYKVELSNNLDLTEQGSLTIGDVNIAGDKVDVGGNTITNVANGTNATDAVNLSQLNASKANVVAGTNVQVSSSSDENGTTYTVNAYNTTASGSDAVSVEGKFDASTNTTNYAIDLSQATKDQIKKEESVSQGSNVIVTANGTNDTGGKDFLVSISNDLDLTDKGSLTIGDVNIAGDKVDVGGNTITNVANGTNATDAVNLSQLNASKANVVAGTNVQVSSSSDENGTTYTVNAYNTTASGSDAVSVEGKFDATTNTTNYAIDLSQATKDQIKKEESVSQGSNVIVTANGTNDTGGKDFLVSISNDLDLTDKGSLTIGDVNIAGNKVDVGGNTITNVANGTNATDAVNLSQLNASKANVVAGTNVQVSSSSDENGTTYTVNAYNTTASGSELVSVVAGELDPTTNTTNYAIDLSDKAKAQLAKEESVSQGSNVIVTANGTNDTGGTDYLVSLSNDLDLTEKGSLTIGNVSIAGDKVDVGGNTITNVADGTNATDAVNLSQLNASKANVVAGTNVQVSSSSDENGTTYTVNAYNTTASGSELVSVVAGELDPTTNTTNYAIDLSDKAKAQLAKEESVEAGSDAVSVKLDGTNETGGNKYVVDLSDETKTQLAKEESVSQGNNVIVTTNGTNDTGGTDYKVELSNNLDLTEQGSLTIGDVNIAGDKVDVGGNTITNVADGTNATDAVNLSQLNASKANVVAGTNVQVSSTSDENGTTYTVNAYNTTASGSELVSVVAGELDPTTNTTNYAIDLSETAKAQLAKEESVEAGSDAVSVKLDGTNETGGNKYVVDLSDETKAQIAKEEDVVAGSANIVVKQEGTNTTGGKTFTVAANTAELSNEANGKVALKDLATANQELSNAITALVSANTAEEKAAAQAKVDSATANVTRAGNALATAENVQNAVNNSGWTTTLSNGSTVLVNPSDQVNYVDGSGTESNVTVKQVIVGSEFKDTAGNTVYKAGENSYIYANGTAVANPNSVVESAIYRDVVSVSYDVAQTELKISDGTQTHANGTTANQGEVVVPDSIEGNKFVNATTLAQTINSAGWNVQSNKVAGSTGEVTAGSTTTPTKVSSGNTLNVNAGNNIIITRTERDIAIATSLTPTFNNVTVTNDLTVKEGANVNMGNNQIHNVRAGTADTDAVNLGQLKRGLSDVHSHINKTDKNLRAGIAGATATAGLYHATLPGKSMVSVGAGTYKGESAIAMGYSRLSDNGKLGIKFSLNTNTRGDTGAAASIGYQW